MEAPAKYAVLCAWCEREGRETVLNWSTVAHSHGICAEHREGLRKEMEEIRTHWRDEGCFGSGW